MKIPSGYKRMLLLATIIVGGFLATLWFCTPNELFDDPFSTVIESREGLLLGAKIADDGQWRFPLNPQVPEKFKNSLLAFEDQYFFQHPGVNLFSLLRASWLNIKAGEIVSGGSTLSMQVIRLSRKGKARTIFEKSIEIFLAFGLELHHSKSEILAMYASFAPFGGNVVGLDAASWRYYGRPAKELSWAESATLAVLPNAPSLIYPGKNQVRLLEKRNKLLQKLLDAGTLDDLSYELALLEPLPEKPKRLGQDAPHLLNRIAARRKGQRTQTTLDYYLQKEVTKIVDQHHNKLQHNQVYNAAVLVVRVETGEVLSYVGNTRSKNAIHACDVDIIPASRSSGSILKPILYAAMLDDGLILPNTLVPDIPTQIGGFNPMNFDRSYSGAVPAQKALYRSLNVPAVKMLQEYGVQRFQNILQEIGVKSLTQTADHYGLSLILGGAEVSMLDLANVYSSFSRLLKHYYTYSGKYDLSDFRPVYTVADDKPSPADRNLQLSSVLNAASIWYTYEAMQKVNRPESLSGWDSFSSTQKIAWKTGTSFGFRDAWAVGTTAEYVVVVWVGNADGEGRPGLTGVSSAAPLMFDVFNLLPEAEWFDPPFDEMTEVAICRSSGYRVGQHCNQLDTMYIPSAGLNTEPCPFHVLIHLDQESRFRVTDECYDPDQMLHEPWFVLPAVMEWYYKRKNPSYPVLPPFSSHCDGLESNPMDFVYPGRNNKLFIPLNMSGRPESIVLELAHREDNARVFWYLDENYLGHTKFNHQIEIQPNPGEHFIHVIDQAGRQLSKKIEVVGREGVQGSN